MASKTFRSYAIERDGKGMPVKMVWLGDHPIPARKTKAEIDAERLAEYERVYGTRTEPRP